MGRGGHSRTQVAVPPLSSPLERDSLEINPWKLWRHLWGEIIIFLIFVRGKTSWDEHGVLSGVGAGSRAVRAASGSGRAGRALTQPGPGYGLIPPKRKHALQKFLKKHPCCCPPPQPQYRHAKRLNFVLFSIRNGTWGNARCISNDMDTGLRPLYLVVCSKRCFFP